MEEIEQPISQGHQAVCLHIANIVGQSRAQNNLYYPFHETGNRLPSAIRRHFSENVFIRSAATLGGSQAGQ